MAPFLRKILAAGLAVLALTFAGPQQAAAQFIGGVPAPVLLGQRDAYPGATLALDFVGSQTNGTPYYKAFGVTTSNFSAIPNLTVSRATPDVAYGERVDGTLVPFGANVARITDKGLLVEEARTNLLLRSQEFDNATWTRSSVTVTADAGLAPDGTLTADKITPLAVATTFKEVQQNISVTTGVSYTFTIFAKASGYNFVQVVGTTTHFGQFAINYDLSTGTETAFAAGAGNVTSRTITAFTNGWYRIAVTVTALADGVAAARLGVDYIPASNSIRGVSWTPDGTSGVLHWGAQIEAGAFPTSYIPTTTAAVTRAADALSFAVSGVAYDGTWLQDTQAPLFSYSARKVLLSSAAQSLSLLWSTTGQQQSRIVNGGGTVFTTAAGAAASNALVKGATSISGTSHKEVQNGSAVVTNVITAFSETPNGLLLGSAAGSTSMLNGYLRKLIYYVSTTFTDAQLQALTQ